MLRVIAPQSKVKIKQQIKALQSVLATDNMKDKLIHQQAIIDLKEALKKL